MKKGSDYNMDKKKSNHPDTPTKSEYLHGANKSPDDFDEVNKDNAMTHIDNPKKEQ